MLNLTATVSIPLRGDVSGKKKNLNATKGNAKGFNPLAG